MLKMAMAILGNALADDLAAKMYFWTDANYSPSDSDFLINDTGAGYTQQLFHNYTLDDVITKKVSNDLI